MRLWGDHRVGGIVEIGHATRITGQRVIVGKRGKGAIRIGVGVPTIETPTPTTIHGETLSEIRRIQVGSRDLSKPIIDHVVLGVVVY
jgi:hypothetical protein